MASTIRLIKDRLSSLEDEQKAGKLYVAIHAPNGEKANVVSIAIVG